MNMEEAMINSMIREFKEDFIIELDKFYGCSIRHSQIQVIKRPSYKGSGMSIKIGDGYVTYERKYPCVTLVYKRQLKDLA